MISKIIDSVGLKAKSSLQGQRLYGIHYDVLDLDLSSAILKWNGGRLCLNPSQTRVVLDLYCACPAVFPSCVSLQSFPQIKRKYGCIPPFNNFGQGSALVTIAWKPKTSYRVLRIVFEI